MNRKQQTTGDPSPIDEDVVMHKFAGDTGICLRVILSFLSNYEAQILAMDQALAHQDLKSLHRAVHTIKGSVSTFSTTLVYKTALTMELMLKENRFTEATGLHSGLKAEIRAFAEYLKAFQTTLEAEAP